jgi:phosphoribosylformylglycinamidine cyclo-ligase
MSDVYAPGDFDLAGFAVGVVDLPRAIKPTRVKVGDVVLGLESDGIHSNGYSLVRKVVREAGLDLGKVYEELGGSESARQRGSEAGKGEGTQARRHEGTKGRRKKSGDGERARTLGEVLLTPTRIYAGPIVKLQRTYTVKNVISGMAHITGSGMVGNLERALHKGVDAVVDTRSWEVPAVFRFLQEKGGIAEAEMRRVFNMGIGYTLIVRPAFADSIAEQLTKLGERVHVIGKVVKGTGVVREV